MNKFYGTVFLILVMLVLMTGCTQKETTADTVPATTIPVIATEAVKTVVPTEADDTFIEEEIPISEESVTEPETEPVAKPEKDMQEKPVVVPDLGGNGGGGPHEMGEDEF